VDKRHVGHREVAADFQKRHDFVHVAAHQDEVGEEIGQIASGAAFHLLEGAGVGQDLVESVRAANAAISLGLCAVHRDAHDGHAMADHCLGDLLIEQRAVGDHSPFGHFVARSGCQDFLDTRVEQGFVGARKGKVIGVLEDLVGDFFEYRRVHGLRRLVGASDF